MQDTLEAKALLSAHKDTREVSIYDVDAIPTPPPTRTWLPVPHMEVLYTIDEMVHDYGWSFADYTESRYRVAVSKNGEKMFGVTKINIPGIDNPDAQLAIGFRNSHNKTLALRLAVGRIVFICDNLVMTGDIQSRRIHSWNIDVGEVVIRAFDQVPAAAIAMYKWGDYLKEISLSVERGVALLAEAVEFKALPIQDFMSARADYISAYENNNPAIQHGGTAWSAYEAVTAQYKKHIISRTQDYSIRLNDLVRNRFKVAV